ncbi:MAG: hypothetical protein J3K34DRAFT_414964 [Monoraphidium minutum]|nr:MAG: hypothetical protein J3K34DRAFT_414964 [Monoraphidium minutum]
MRAPAPQPRATPRRGTLGARRHTPHSIPNAYGPPPPPGSAFSPFCHKHSRDHHFGRRCGWIITCSLLALLSRWAVPGRRQRVPRARADARRSPVLRAAVLGTAGTLCANAALAYGATSHGFGGAAACLPRGIHLLSFSVSKAGRHCFSSCPHPAAPIKGPGICTPIQPSALGQARRRGLERGAHDAPAIAFTCPLLHATAYLLMPGPARARRHLPSPFQAWRRHAGPPPLMLHPYPSLKNTRTRRGRPPIEPSPGWRARAPHMRALATPQSRAMPFQGSLPTHALLPP